MALATLLGAPVASLWYFFYFAASAFLYPYMALFYRRLGLPEHRIGLLAGMRPWVSGPSGPIFAGLADAYSCHGPLMIGMSIGALLTRLCFLGASGLPTETAKFGALMVLVIVSEVMSGPLTVLADACTVGSLDNDADYGKYRLWGAVSWGTVNGIAGGCIALFGIYSLFGFYAAFAALALIPAAKFDFGVLRAGAVGSHPHADSSPEGAPEVREVEMGELDAHHREGAISAADVHHRTGPSKPQSRRASVHQQERPAGRKGKEQEVGGAEGAGTARWRTVLGALRRPQLSSFLFIASVWGYCVGTIEGFLFLYLDQLGASEVLMGVTLTVTCVAEVPVFHYVPRILSVVGTAAMVHVVCVAFVLRLGFYSVLGALPSPWLVLPIELLHGVTFGCAWAVGCIVARRGSPPGMQATFQGIFQMLYFGFGHGVGGVAGGYIYEIYGPVAVFHTAGAVILVGWAAYSTWMVGLRAVGAAPHGDAEVEYAAVDTEEGGEGPAKA